MLQDIEVRKAKSQEKPYKLTDERGLYVLVNPNGGKLWGMNYRHDGKQKTLSFGTYPDVTLADARTRRDEARQLRAQGIDPSAQKKAIRASAAERAANSFEVIAREWLQKNSGTWVETTHRHIKGRLEASLFPWIGSRPIAEITPRELLAALNKTVERGRIDTAQRVRSDAGRIFRFAVATGRAERDTAADLQVTLKHRLRVLAPGLTPRAVLEKMAALQMVDVHLPTTDGRCLILSRYTQPEKDRQFLLSQLKLALPEQPPPKITANGTTSF